MLLSRALSNSLLRSLRAPASLPGAPASLPRAPASLAFRYWDLIAANAGFTLVYVPVSQASRTKFGSLWTACANDVGAGRLDLCVGNFWPTPERIAATSANFLVPTSKDSFQLLHPPYEVAKSSTNVFWTWTKPFTYDVWAAIVATWFLCGAAYYILGAEEDMTRNKTEVRRDGSNAFKAARSISKKTYVP